MEQVYNYTQDDPSYHNNGIKNYADEIKTKASQLKGTAETQSNIELSTTRNNDIEGDEKKGSQLPEKAGLLKEAAQLLHDKANELASDAATQDSPLSTLSSLARLLKNAAGTDGSGESLYEAAEQLANPGSSGLEGKAKDVITKFDEVQKAYDKLMEEAKKIKQEANEKVKAVDTEYIELKGMYDGMLNLTKLAVKANALTTLSAAGNLKIAVETLRNQEASTQAYTNAQAVIQNYETVENTYSKLPEDKTNVQTQFDALKTLYNKIFKFTKATKVKTAAGANPSTGLRQKAQELYTKANELNDAVIAVDQENAAKVLMAKAGTLLGLAAKLHETASALAQAIGDGSDNNAASVLATVVGSDEITATDKLRAKLKALADQNASQAEELTTKAREVKSQYGTVSLAFNAVEGKKGDYESAGKESEYQSVEKAWNDFNNVYKPEELLKDAVGQETGQNNLANALKALGTANDDDPLLPTLAKTVKDKYSNFIGTGVKSKFGLVENQVEAYQQGGTIKSTYYDPLKNALDSFNTAYRKAIYPEKFYSIIVPSIITILSDWSPKTEFLLHSQLFKFGGWTGYNANEFGNSGFEKGGTVYGWILHFFDIIH